MRAQGCPEPDLACGHSAAAALLAHDRAAIVGHDLHEQCAAVPLHGRRSIATTLPARNRASVVHADHDEGVAAVLRLSRVATGRPASIAAAATLNASLVIPKPPSDSST